MVVDGDMEHEVSGGEYTTTNNRMELLAVIEALRFIEASHVAIYTDSLWVLNCAKGSWKRKANLDMWKEFDQVACKKTIDWNWVRGHNGDTNNERVDKLARGKAVYYNSLLLR
jgi:ribonuclease HI